MKRKAPVRDAIAKLAPYQPGKPIEEVSRDLGLTEVIKMASNENPLGPSAQALEAIRLALPKVHLYPDGGGYLLKRKLAEKFGLDARSFTLGNGSSDILAFALWAFVNPGDEVLTSQATFLMYPILASIAHGKLVEVPLKKWSFDLEAMAKKINRKTKVIFLCNPNNPTGTIFRAREWKEFLARVPEAVVVVVDEAYVEFVDDVDFPDSLEAVRQGKNVIVLRTFSKIVGLAGLRIGFGMSTPQIADWLNRVRPPFNTNSLAQAAAVAALDDEEHILRTKQIIRQGREFLFAQLGKLGLECIPSHTNYLMVNVKQSAEALHQKLLRKGIIVRSMKSFGFKNYIRVSVGTMDQNKRFISELKKILGRI